ncbi:MAG TPA: IS200/IS605 family transposase [Ignavibacteriaceae bacterium]|nr:IS200/IS605 family transposase [Ignavibacteriaceae bacterium]
MALAKIFMPFTKIWIHIIWSTKNREKIITKELKKVLLEHIIENAKLKGIFIKTINCVNDHVHLLISLGREQSISKVVMMIKGESSNWVNKNKLVNGKFEWQDEYIAVSVSESVVDKVFDYIKNQEEHHRNKSFEEEFNLFLKKYNFG